MRKTKKIKKRHRGGAVALCAVLFAVGACSLAAAAVLSARANAAVAHSAELMNALALSDAREELEAANAALGRACAENDTASRAAELAEALDLTARARASLVRAGLGRAIFFVRSMPAVTRSLPAFRERRNTARRRMLPICLRM